MSEQVGPREARLRPEFAALYPGLKPGAWQDAAALAEQMLSEHLVRPSPGYRLSERVLTDEHFEFRVGFPVTGRGLPAHVGPIRLSSSACG